MALNYLPPDQQGEVIERLLSDPATDLRADQGRMIAEIAGRHPDVVDRALRIRVEQGLELPWRFEEDYLIYGRTVDDGPVHALVTREDLNSDASRNAATLAGPQLVKTLCDRCLATHLDSLRDEDGTVETEPRHPDISAGQPWPLVPTAAA